MDNLTRAQAIALAQQQNVTSSYLLSVGYDTDRRLLCALFADGAVIAYFDVGRDAYDQVVTNHQHAGSTLFRLAKAQRWTYKKVWGQALQASMEADAQSCITNIPVVYQRVVHFVTHNRWQC